MRDLTARGSHGNPKTLQSFLTLRMIVVALVVGAGVMIIQLGQDTYPVGPLYVLLVAGFVVGALTFFAVRVGIDPTICVWSLLVADILIETAILHYSGGATSRFSLVYCLSIIAGAFLLQARGAMGIAALASISYVLYGVLQSKGIMHPSAAAYSLGTTSQGVLQSYLHVSLFLLVGLVSGHLSNRIRWNGRELQTAQTELKQLRLDTDNILNHMSSGVIVVDSEACVARINPTAALILDVDDGDVIGLTIESAFGERLPELNAELRQALLPNERHVRHEFTINRSNGRPIPLGLSTSQLLDEQGNIRGVIAVFQDLTQVRDMQARIRKADRLAAIGELSAAIAHEIRNPLASISGSIEMLSNELQLDGENAHLMELITKESDRLDRIISDFLEFARLRSPSMTEMSLTECLEDVLVLLRNNPSVTQDAQLHIAAAAREAKVQIDEEQMKQVLFNLAINASEANGTDGLLSIKTEITNGGWIAVRFQDDGSGIDEDTASRLFEPFFTTKEGGTGLGLAIANKIIEAHGGRITFQNREEGGAEFSVILPPAVNAAVKAGPQQAGASPGVSDGGHATNVSPDARAETSMTKVLAGKYEESLTANEVLKTEL